MIKVTIAFDYNKTAREFTFGWIFNRLIVPIIKLSQCLWFEVTDDVTE